VASIPSVSDLEFQLKEFAAQLARLAAGRPSERRFEGNQKKLWHELSSSGWLLVGVSEKSGGAGLELSHLLEFAELWGRHLLPVPFMATVHVHRWTDGQFMTGWPSSTAFTFGISPSATSPQLVPFLEWPGIRLMTSTSPQPVSSITTASGRLDGFAPSLPIGEVPAASAMSRGQFDDVCALAAAEAGGCARAVLEWASEYAGQREAFGRPIVRFQAVRHLLAEMHRDVEMAKSAAIWAAERDEVSCLSAARESLRLSQRAIATGIQVFGGIGFTWELGVHFYLRHVMALRRLLEAEV
jgi:alkylation response protein AidB-like acyl-CoA dehydrogenase